VRWLNSTVVENTPQGSIPGRVVPKLNDACGLSSLVLALGGWVQVNASWAVLPLLRSEIPSGICAKLSTVAASNNGDHPTRSLFCCLFAPHIYIFVLRAHPVRGESHNQRNATGEVATLSMQHSPRKWPHGPKLEQAKLGAGVLAVTLQMEDINASIGYWNFCVVLYYLLAIQRWLLRYSDLSSSSYSDKYAKIRDKWWGQVHQ